MIARRQMIDEAALAKTGVAVGNEAPAAVASGRERNARGRQR